MTEMPDAELLEQFARDHSESAFAALVERHIALVHSVALRHTADPQHAQDITQATFIILARKAGSMNRKTVLPGWLYHTTRLTAANFERAEFRRIQREQEAYMQSTLQQPAPDAPWPEMSRLLDEAMSRLGARDRDALVLRYFQNKSLAEVGVTMGLKEHAAQKRVTRSIEKLRKFFAQRGVTLTATAIAGAVSANSGQAAPAGLAVMVAATAAKGAAIGSSTYTIVQGALKVMAWTKWKTAAVICILVILGAGTTVVLTHHEPTAALPTGLGSINLINTQVAQVLELYKVASGLELTISPEVKNFSYTASIALKADQIDRAEMAKLIEKSLFEQTGIVITKNGSNASVTYNGTRIGNPMRPSSPAAAAVQPK